ncbi:MAG: hypothetical protein WA459_01780 [Stellaceae bacterium]
MALIATGASDRINPPPDSGPSSTELQQQPQLAALPPPYEASSPVDVAAWGFADSLPGARDGASSAAIPGRPLYLWMTINGGPAAVDRLAAEGRLAIEVHRNREATGATAGAPDLVTELTVGRPELASIFAQKVRTEGHFQWHSWTRKDSLSPGRWTVSLTYPDGQAVLCGSSPGAPCRLSIDVGAPSG